MRKLTFYVDTDAESFSRLLEDCMRTAPSNEFPTEKGLIRLRAAYCQPSWRTAGYIQYDIEGYYIGAPTEDNLLIPMNLGGVISFKIVSVSHDRVKVTARCGHEHALARYFAQLLNCIGEAYPGALEQHLEFLAMIAGDESIPVTEEEKSWEDPEIAKRREDVKKLFHTKMLYWQIANEVGCSVSTVRRYLKAMGLRRRKARKKQ